MPRKQETAHRDVSVRMPRTLYVSLRKVAKDDRRTMSEIMRFAIEDYTEAHETRQRGTQ